MGAGTGRGGQVDLTATFAQKLVCAFGVTIFAMDLDIQMLGSLSRYAKRAAHVTNV